MQRICRAGVATMAVVLTLISYVGTVRAQPRDGGTKIYAVIFGVLVNEKGELGSYRVERVTDPSAGKTDSVNVKVSKEYQEKAGKIIRGKRYKPKIVNGKAVEFYTYFLLDPRNPDAVLTEIPK